ncbi:MAG: hypothetical protein R2813_07710 [Flavobacteriales bacterium]
MSETNNSKRVQKLIEELGSRDERKVIGALKRVPHEGSAEIIIPMLHLLAKDPSSEIQLLLQNSLYNLKDPNALEPLIAALRDKQLKGIRSHVLTCIWQSGLDASAELDLLINIAVEDDFMCAVEVLTIVDNTEHYSDDLLSGNIKKLDKAINEQADKAALLGNLRQVLLDKLLDE